MERICDVPVLHLDPSDRAHWLAGIKTILTRVDCTAMYELASRADAEAWVYAVGQYATARHRGRSDYDNGMVYWSKKSRRSSHKFYPKGREMLGSGPIN